MLTSFGSDNQDKTSAAGHLFSYRNQNLPIQSRNSVYNSGNFLSRNSLSLAYAKTRIFSNKKTGFRRFMILNQGLRFFGRRVFSAPPLAFNNRFLLGAPKNRRLFFLNEFLGRVGGNRVLLPGGFDDFRLI